MARSRINLNHVLVTIILALFVLTVLGTAISMAPIAKAQTTSGPSISLYPTSGPVGTDVSVNGQDYTGPATITFNGQNVGTTGQPYSWSNLIYGTFDVPNVAQGSYTVTASDTYGDSASASFTVTAGSTSSSSTSSSGTSSTSPPIGTYPPSSTTQPYVYPTYTTPVQSAGFWSPLAIAIVVIIAFVVIIPMTLVLRSRVGGGKREILLEKEPTPYRPEPYTQPYQPTPGYNPSPTGYNQPPSRYSQYIASRYGSPTSSRYTQRPTYGPSSTTPSGTGRYIPPSSNVQPSAVGRTCPHCGRVVRGDYNICPYCYKRIR